MTIEQLALMEDELYSSVMDLYRKPASLENNYSLYLITQKYKEVHQQYSKLAFTDVEALKRGLFIQWYALTEPTFLTGIGELKTESENRIIEELQKRIDSISIDFELKWMLNYYASWEWCFDHVKSFQGFDSRIVNEKNNKLPESIDKEKEVNIFT